MLPLLRGASEKAYPSNDGQTTSKGVSVSFKGSFPRKKKKENKQKLGFFFEMQDFYLLEEESHRNTLENFLAIHEASSKEEIEKRPFSISHEQSGSLMRNR